MAATAKSTSRAFQLWKPTVWCRIRRIILSDSFAWAVQNASGVLFTLLFVFIGKMTFTLACVSACLYSAGSQVLSLDRTLGGRLFSAVLFTGCMLSGGALGGGLSTLAWLARGDAMGLLQYLTSVFQKIPSKHDIALINKWLPRVAALPLPDFARAEFAKVQAEVLERVEETIPEVDAAFWILLMVLPILVAIPFSVARANKDFRLGILMAVATLFMGSQLIFGSLLPTLGLRLFWTQVTAGYIKVALVNAGAMVITGVLFFATSSHDEARKKLGIVLEGTGALLSRSGSIVAVRAAGTKLSMQANFDAGSPTDAINKEAVCHEVSALAEEETANPLRKDGLIQAATDEESSTNFNVFSGLKSALDLQGDAHAVTEQLAATIFEPPLPGICSQPGSNRNHYTAVLHAVEHLLSVAGSIESCAIEAQFEFNMEAGSYSTTAGIVRDAISIVLASCAASCGDLSVALRHIPLWGPCSGPQIIWRPKSDSFWCNARDHLQEGANGLSAMLAGPDSGDITDTKTGHLLLERRATLALLTNCEMLIEKVIAVEKAAAIALDLRAEMEMKTAREGSSEDSGATPTGNPGKDNENISIKEKLINNAYAPNFLMLLALGLGIPVWLEVIKATVAVVSGTWAFCRSAATRSEILNNRRAQFAFKFWLGVSLAIMGIILLLWKGKGSAGNILIDAYNIDYFFFIWQPIYFWITTVICLQQQVEASVFRAVLRTTMTVLGGVLGYCTMLNGTLANNPYFVGSITCAFNAFCGLFSPIKVLRYSLFVTAFTFNAVVACQYFGCCGLPGDPKIFGGKVLSTMFGSLYAIILSWCFMPYYTSVVMFGEEAAALRAGMELISEQHKWMAQAVVGPVEQPKDKWQDTIETKMRVPLSQVKKELETNVLDRKELLLSWNVLPTPPIVSILMDKISRLTDYLAIASNISDSSLWPGEAGPAQAALLTHLELHTGAVRSAGHEVVESCVECMMATSRTEVLRTRKKVAEGVDELRIARAALRAEYLLWNTNTNLDHPVWLPPDLRFQAWLHLTLLALKEIEVVGVVLAETEAALDRDSYFAWASSWFGRRPVYV